MPAAAQTHPRLRGSTPRETGLIAGLLARSPTARALADELLSTDVIAYVQLVVDQAPGRASTRLVVATSTHRFLRIALGAMTSPADRGSLLGHELQHAVEIARAREVRDDDGMRRLYLVIGEDSRARDAFETAAAREVGLIVRRELTKGPPVTVAADRPKAVATVAATEPDTARLNDVGAPEAQAGSATTRASGDGCEACLDPPAAGSELVDALLRGEGAEQDPVRLAKRVRARLKDR
jgi:hypothetical protein